MRPATSTSPAATGTSRSWCGSRRSSGRAPRRSRTCASARQGPNGIDPDPAQRGRDACKLVSGASYIYREQQERYLPIKFSVRDRDLGSAIQEAQRKIAEQVQLPPGSRLEWVGEFGNLQEAIARLKIVVPLSLALIALLLWINFGSVADTLLAMSVIPMAVIGGIFALLLTRHPVQRLGRDRLHRAVRHLGDGRHHHPVAVQPADRAGRGADAPRSCAPANCRCARSLMTCMIAGVGLLPAALSSGIGSQVQKPLAVVVVGGMMLAPFVILIDAAGADRDVFAPETPSHHAGCRGAGDRRVTCSTAA